jgi:hypothetical protein
MSENTINSLRDEKVNICELEATGLSPFSLIPQIRLTEKQYLEVDLQAFTPLYLNYCHY